jgi:hypothetical protein
MSKQQIVRGSCLAQTPSRWSNARRMAVVAAALCCLSVLVGCGRSGPVRFDVRGTVRFNGEPLPRGTIRFEPDASKGNRGPVGIASIVDGEYTTAERGAMGSLEGPLVVWITGLPAADPNVEMPSPLFVDHRVDVDFRPATRGSTPLDFDIAGNTQRK